MTSAALNGKDNPALAILYVHPRDDALEAEYRRFPSISDIFPVNSVGIVTARDHLTIRWSEQEVWDIVRAFSQMDPELARQAYQLGKDTRDWKVTLAQKDLRDSGPTRENVVPILYRPFDVRHTYYTGWSRGFISTPRHEVMRHMLVRENLALITPKQHKDEFGALTTRFIGDRKSVAAYDVNYYFPLYRYPTPDRNDLFAQLEPTERQPNLNPNLVVALEKAHGSESSPEEFYTTSTPFCMPRPTARNTPSFCGATFRAFPSHLTENCLPN